MSKTIKKILTIALVFTTVAWSMGFAVIGVANAASISAGDLIKGSGSAVYYYGADGKRYVFPTESTYKTWYGDFSGVKTITDSELAAIGIGGNATARPGTKLVKINTDPKTYAVEPGGKLRHLDSEARAIALYGNDWNKKIIDIPESFWINYTTGSAIDSNMHPEGSLIKYSGSATVYYIESGKKRAVSSEGFSGNNFNFDNVLTIGDSITYSDGSALSGEETEITNVAGGANAGGTGGSSLMVALASDTPASGIVVENAARVPFTKINLTAGTDGDITIDTLTVKRVGIGQDGAFSDLDLLDASTDLPINTNSKSLNSEHMATFTKDFTVSAGTTKSIILAGNMAASLDSYAGETPTLALESLTLKSGSVSGTLPIVGNAQTLNSTITIGSATVQRGAYVNASSTSIEVGKENYTFQSFKIQAGSAEKLEFSQVKVYQSGSASLDDDLSGIELLEDGTKLADGMIDGKYVNFSFPTITLDKGQTRQFQVKADVVDGSSRTIKLGIYKATDLLLKGVTNGYNITPSYTGTGSGASSPILNDNQFTISGGTLTVSKSNSVGATNIGVSDDQILGAFEFKVKGEPIDITALTLTIASSTGSAIILEDALTGIELIDADGNVVAGPSDITNNVLTVAFTDTFTLPVGENIYRVRGDFATNGGWTSDNTIYARINTPTSAITAEGTVTGLTVAASPGSAIDTNTQTIKATSLAVTRDTLPASASIIIGSSDVELGSWTFDATDSGEDIRVTSIAFAASSSNAQNLTVYVDGESVDPVNDAPTAADGATSTFAFDDPIIITKGTQKTVKLKGDIASSATATNSAQFGITSNAAVSSTGVSTGNTVTASVTSDNGPTLTYVARGTLTISSTGNPAKAILISGSTGNVMTKVKLKAQYEELDLNTLRVYVADGEYGFDNTGNYQDVVNVAVYDGATKIAEGNIPSTGYHEFNFDVGDVTIPTTGEKILTIKADFSNVDELNDNSPGTTNAGIKIGIGGSYNGIKTTGMDSNLEIISSSETYQGATSSAMVLRNTAPTVTLSKSGAPMGANTTLTDGGALLYAFKVTPDSSGEVYLYRTTFRIATSGTAHVVKSFYIQDEDGNTVSESTGASMTGWQDDGAGTGWYSTTFNSPDVSAGDTKEALEIASAKTFYLYADVSNTASGDTVSISFLGDTATTTGSVGTTASGGSLTADNTADNFTYNNQGNFVWSDNVLDKGLDTDGANATAYAQWYNGYLVSGLGTTVTSTAYTIGRSS